MNQKHSILLVIIVMAIALIAGCVEGPSGPGQFCSNVQCKDPWGDHYYNFSNVTDFKHTYNAIFFQGYSFKRDGVVENRFNCECVP